MKKTLLLCFSFSAVTIAFLLVLAVLSTAVYYDPSNNIRYETPLTLQLFVGALPPSGDAVRTALTSREWLLAVCMSVGLIVLTVTRNHENSAARCVNGAIQSVVLYWGWMGLIALPLTLLTRLDGEFLAEGFPTLIVCGLWLAWNLTVSIVSWDRRGEVA